jgi:hypothetical protein
MAGVDWSYHQIWPGFRPIPSREEGANCVPRGSIRGFPTKIPAESWQGNLKGFDVCPSGMAFIEPKTRGRMVRN